MSLARLPEPGLHERSAAGPVTSRKDTKVKFKQSSAKLTSAVALILLASTSNLRVNAQSLTTDSESGLFLNAMKSDAHAAQNQIANPIYDNDPIVDEPTSTSAIAADSWGPVATKKTSVANLAPFLLPY